MNATAEYDYVIAGGGSSACAAAAHLVRGLGARVLIVERGPAETARLMRLPAGYMKFLARDDFLEMHHTVPQQRLGGRGPIVPQGKALGGGSAVNAMVYMRGQREDYDGWDEMLGGGSGWGYEDVLPHFRAVERNTKFNDRYHGIDGGLLVSDPGQICGTARDYLLTTQGMGFALNPDFNGARQAGVGVMQHTMGVQDGRMQRCDAVTAFLKPLAGDPRLTIVTDALVTRVVTDRGRAVGIEYRHNGQTILARAAHEVLVAAGTYNTAKLLMLSGIGPAAELALHDIDVVADLPGIGANLQDHHEVPVIAATLSARGGYFGEDKGWRMLRNGLQYVAFGTGPVTTTGIETCLFYDPDGGERPTIQLYCCPIVYLDRDVSDEKPTHGVTLTSCLLRPKARGNVRLRSADPAAPPVVDSNFFGDPDDLRLTIASLRFAREVLTRRPIADNVGREILPGAGAIDDAALSAHCARTVKTNYHPVGTARMGPAGDPMAVLDDRLRVRGVDGLRVIDCAAIPAIPSGNTNAAAIMLGHKAAAMIAAERAGSAAEGANAAAAAGGGAQIRNRIF